VSSIDIKHVRVDENDRYIETINDGLNDCLTVEANIDQTGRALIFDLVYSMCDEGVVALVPVETDKDAINNSSFDIYNMRVAKVVEWRPYHVKVNLYNERTGRREDILLPKSMVSIIENPFYSIMNEPNSTLRRLVRKLNILDAIDEQSGSGKLDLIIQLPYVLKSTTQKEQAEARRKDIEQQLAGSKYGIAYTDGTERITQLNRPAENNLQKQIEYLTEMLYSQLGITKGIMEGSASEQEMENYYSRTIEPIISAICDEMKRKFLTKTARTQGQSIKYFRSPFKLVPAAQLAEMADKFIRNAVLSKNEFRAELGFKPSDDPSADELSNPNINQSSAEQGYYDEPLPEDEGYYEEDENY
jgi:HK97 family phage portal protein